MDNSKSSIKEKINEKKIKYSDTKDDENKEDLVMKVKLSQNKSRWRSLQAMMYMASNRYELYLPLEETSVIRLSKHPGHNDGEIDGDITGILKFSTRRYVGRFFDSIAKELIMKCDSDEITMFVNHARTIRIRREVAEANRRQIEVTARSEQDEKFKQVMKIHQDIATFITEPILEEAIEQCVNKDRLKLIKYNTKSMSHRDIVHGRSAETVLDMIIPEANRILQRETEDTRFKQHDVDM